MHLGCELTSLTRFPPLSMALMTTCIRAFLFPIGIQLILMKHEERIPMKLFKTLCSSAFIFTMSVAALLLVISILGQALALGFYAVVLALTISAISYLFFRRSN
jgi:hypothetical protein